MYVTEMVLEGFKTYMNRTVISDFDPQFNAITGLNGSGKSNILDAIQFVIGSTSKEMLRLKTGLTELIYKEGYAGIEKASVTIKFSCPFREARPTGYEECSELVISRQITKDKVSKFFVNGVSSNLTRVKNVFRSVQLNIDNPHFLVKQGQITKVINLKPLELLAMLEETAGTAFYNKTKQDSERTIERKEVKLKTVNEILQSSIQPQINRMDADRRRYVTFKDREGYLRNLCEKARTFEFNYQKAQIKKLKDAGEILSESLLSLTSDQSASTSRLGSLEGELKAARQKGTISVMAEFNKITYAVNEKKNERQQVQARLAALRQEALSMRQQATEAEHSCERSSQEINWLSRKIIQTNKLIADTEEVLKKTFLGTADMGHALVAQEQGIIDDLQGELKLLLGKQKQLKEDEVREKNAQNEAECSRQETARAVEALEREIAQLSQLKTPIAVDDPQVSTTALSQLEADKNRLLNQNYQLSFNYSDPHPGFDRTKVKGKLFSLFRVVKVEHQKALQIGAGGKLHFIVVENEIVSKALIEKETFGRNVTIIPNNKIRFKELRSDVLVEAHRIAVAEGGTAEPAYKLIEYSQDLSNSIMLAFSNFLVCSSATIAQRIAFNSNRQLGCKCVTYDGDVFEQGTLTGGHTNPAAMILRKQAEYHSIEMKLREERGRFEKQKALHDEYSRKLADYKGKTKLLESKIERRDKLKQRTMNMNSKQVSKDYALETKQLQGKISSLEKQIVSHRDKLNKLAKPSSTSIQDTKKQLEKDLSNYRTELAENNKRVSKNQVQQAQLKETIKHLGTNEEQLLQQVAQLEKNETQLGLDQRHLQTELERVQQERHKYEKQCAINEAHLAVLSKEVTELRAAQERINAQIHKVRSQKDSMDKDRSQVESAFDKLLLQNPWLKSDQDYELDKSFNYDQTVKEIRVLTAEVDQLRKTAAPTMDDMSFQKLQEQFKSLLDKKDSLHLDKMTLLSNMNELDDKRSHTLDRCFSSVKTNLRDIFSDLLPGASAELIPLDPHDITKGAELCVFFSGVKKELSELSGGQRSLLALSFMLALLLYKPSPFYILDEIDSALDLSHTENIGYMISQRFPQSQFLLISLKEGMFQNANVLYRVRFAEGQSKVDRQVVKKKR